MNKQELIEIIIKNIDDIGAYALGIDALLAQGILGLRNQVNGLKEQQDQRIAELEKENEEKEDKILDLKSYNSDLKETISKLSFSAVRCQAINDEVCQYILDNELLKKENAELKEKLVKRK